MIAYTSQEFNSAKQQDLLKLKCDVCGSVYTVKKKNIRDSERKGCKSHACSKGCMRELALGTVERSAEVACKNCGKKFHKKPNQIKKSKNHFCSRSCAATYNNTHKTKGTRRSKLENWLELKLSKKYPNLKIDFNKKDAINSELDIFFPELSLAFELNGIFHYEPIFGEDKLSQVQNNDSRKFQACLEKGIELCIIDTSSQKYFKESSSKKFLEIISSIVDSKL